MSTRKTYWSCTKFADFIRGTKKLKSGTSQEWNKWKRASKEAHRIRYWIAEEGLDKIQDFLNYPLDVYNDCRYYIRNRFITKAHCLTSPSLKPGQWTDLSHRIPECIFSEFIDFIEVEKAWMNVYCDKEASKKYNAPTNKLFGMWKKNSWRCAEAGLDHLRWEMDLVQDEHYTTPDSPDWGKPTPQALQAKEQFEVYTWLKEVRAKRPDPNDASGWSAICANRPSMFEREDEETEEEHKISMDAIHKSVEIENQYDQEDTDMLCRIIKMRNSLWT